jgi:hypothetical protein
MVRKISLDLGSMTVGMKLWSLGTTKFPGYTPEGNYVGGQGDKIVLSSLGRLGKISPIGTITASDNATSVTLANVSGQDAATRNDGEGLYAWVVGHKVALYNNATKVEDQVLTIASVVGQVVTFEEPIASPVSLTTLNTAGFGSAGHSLRYSNYVESTAAQKDIYAFFTKPLDAYPTSRAEELAQQRSGAHNFSDDGLPYILYPVAFDEDL